MVDLQVVVLFVVLVFRSTVNGPNLAKGTDRPEIQKTFTVVLFSRFRLDQKHVFIFVGLQKV